MQYLFEINHTRSLRLLQRSAFSYVLQFLITVICTTRVAMEMIEACVSSRLPVDQLHDTIVPIKDRANIYYLSFPKMLLVFAVFLATTSVLSAQSVDYCGICSGHPLCIYEDIARQCGNTYDRGVSPKLQDYIVSLHNGYRDLVARGMAKYGVRGIQPPASNMKKMKWDPELAAMAQRWADQCQDGHDDGESRVNGNQMHVGQNVRDVRESSSSEVNWARTLSAWFYDEVKKVGDNDIKIYKPNDEIDEYSQLVWAESSSVGCGHMKYSHDGRFYVKYVCNYGPSGNILGEPVYLEGDARSACPESEFDRQYPGLC